MAPALQGGARPCGRRDPAGRRRASGLRRRRARSSRRPAIRPSARRPPGETLADGFFHSLGHGVGLEVHEQPMLGIAGEGELVAGDVVAVEPGCYRRATAAAARGSRARHRDRRENLTRVPVRPRAVSQTPRTSRRSSSRSAATRRRPSSPRRRTRSRRSTTRTSRRSGSARAASASRGSSRSRRSTSGSAPYAKWFLGGKLNVAYNCVDRHVEAGRGDKVAYHWEGEPDGDRRDDHLRRPAARGDRSSRTR